MRLAGLGLLLTLCSAPAHAAAFTAVPFDHWAYQAIEELAAAGLVEPARSGPYVCDGPMTRYDCAVVAMRVNDALARSTQPGARPMDRDTQLAAAIWLHRLTAEFAPELRALGADPAALSTRARKVTFAVVPFDHWAYQVGEELADAELIPDLFTPQPYRDFNPMTRYESAVLTMRASDALARPSQPGTQPKHRAILRSGAASILRLVDEFAPELRWLDAAPDAMQALARRAAAFGDVPLDHWAYQATSRLALEGVLQGYPDGRFARQP